MTVSRSVLCVTYGIIALVALVGTWGNVLGLLGEFGFWGGTVKFWQDVLVNESSRFITSDMLFLMLAVFLWMVLEARRLQIPMVWGYLAFSFFIGPSMGVPLFMIHREFKLADKEPGAPGGTLNTRDVLGLIACGLVFTVYSGIALSR
jgi:hypothetical protein